MHFKRICLHNLFLLCHSGVVILFIREDMFHTKLSSKRNKFNANAYVMKEYNACDTNLTCDGRIESSCQKLSFSWENGKPMVKT